MKQQIPINAIGDISPCITCHYAKISWKEIMTDILPATAILEIEMEEPKIMQIGSYSPSSACNAKVLDPDGLCPTLLDHKGAEPAIVLPLERNPDMTPREISPTIRANSHGALPCVKEPAILTPIRTEEQRQLRKQGIDHFGGRQLLPRTDGVSNTVTTVQKDNLLQEPCVIGSMQANAMRGSINGVSPCLTEAMGKGGGHIPMVTEPSILGYTRDGRGNVKSYHEKEIAGTLHTSSGQGGNTDQFLKEACGLYDNQRGGFARNPMEGMARTLKADGHNAVMLRYRIRKLTPTEAFRLMGVDDSDIDKLKSAKLTPTLKPGKIKEKPMPKTALYKMAGNSIVVDVLYHIFHQMFFAEPPKARPQQLSLFD